MSGVSKFSAERNQRILLDLVNKPGNDVCADCKARTPRWASHNLGIFICMNCASIHRKIGTHITKVKSVTMDSWSREQVEVMKSIGNVASNAKYNPDEARHPPPANREESERDSELEKFIRWKYEFKRFMGKPSPNPSSINVPPTRAQSTPAATMARRSSPLPPLPTGSISKEAVESRPSQPYMRSTTTPGPPPRQSSAPAPIPSSFTPPAPAPAPVSAPNPAPNPALKNPVWNDIMSLANPGPSMSSLPSQSLLQAPSQSQQLPFTSPGSLGSSSKMIGATATNSFPSTMTHDLPGRSASLPVLTSANNPLPTQNMQPQSGMGNPFVQMSPGFPNQMSVNSTSALFQRPPSTSLQQVQVPFGQMSISSFSQSYTPPSALSQQQQQPQFAPNSFPQQFMQPGQMPMQQPLPPAFPQQPPMQGGNPFGPPTWQQQPSGQQPYGHWGGM